MVILEDYIRDIPDFPKKGVIYKDITPLLLNPEAVKTAVQKFLEKLGDIKIDKVVGVESRGFLFATLLAEKLNAGFVPVRKPGKLPYKIHNESYNLEYGSDAIEIHQDAINNGEKILLHDDVLATGGTAAAACRLIEKCGGEVVHCNFLVELEFLEGAKKLDAYELVSLLKF